MRSVLFSIGCLLASALMLAGCDRPRSSPGPSSTVTSAPKAEPKALPDPTSPFRFLDLTDSAGVVSTYHNGEEAGDFSIVESLGGGVAALDFDADGLDDLFFTGGGRLSAGRPLTGLPGTLCRARGQFLFDNVTSAAHVAASAHFSHGAVAGDPDGDGFPDILITGYGGLSLQQNLGDGTFVDTTVRAGFDDRLWSSAAAWGDVNGDGVTDLYVAHYVDWSWEKHPFCEAPPPHSREVCPPRRFDPLPDLLYLGDGAGRFHDASAASGLRTDGKGLGVLLADFDADGDNDIYVANDTVENFLYVNNGRGNFSDDALTSGTALSDRGVPDGSMGIDLLDYNQDGRLDIFVANYESENCALYEQLQNLAFRHVSQKTGITASGSMYVSWGTLAADLDLDGDEDVAVVNGHVLRFPTNSTARQPPLLYENQRHGRFIDRGPSTGGQLAQPHHGRGLAGTDLDNDGRIDLVLVRQNDPALLLRNDSPPQGHWFELELVGARAARDPVGALVTVTTSSARQVRMRRGGGSYLSTHSRRLHWGLGDAESVQAVEIAWPGGTVQRLTDLPADSRWTVCEGGAARRINLSSTPPRKHPDRAAGLPVEPAATLATRSPDPQ